MLSKRVPVIGIIGGMGPAATNDFVSKLIAATPARIDQEHFPLAIWSNPRIPDRNKAIADPAKNPSPVPDLREGARKLQDLGCDFIAIACNTAHHWHADVQSAVRIPVLHIADVAALQLSSMGLGHGDGIGMLCTDGTRQSGYYDTRLRQFGLEAVYPDEASQQDLMKAIYAIKQARMSYAQEITAVVTAKLIQADVKALLVACTELPIVLNDLQQSIPYIDATRCLADACVATARAIEDSH